MLGIWPLICPLYLWIISTWCSQKKVHRLEFLPKMGKKWQKVPVFPGHSRFFPALTITWCVASNSWQNSDGYLHGKQYCLASIALCGFLSFATAIAYVVTLYCNQRSAPGKRLQTSREEEKDFYCFWLCHTAKIIIIKKAKLLFPAAQCFNIILCCQQVLQWQSLLVNTALCVSTCVTERHPVQQLQSQFPGQKVLEFFSTFYQIIQTDICRTWY